MKSIKKKIKIDLVGGARPNFIKIAPLLKLLKNNKKFNVKFINTGQHVDKSLSENIIKDLKLPKPNYDLQVGISSPNQQISDIIKKYDILLEKRKPDLVIVFGDVNSTVAAAISAKKRDIKIAHVEAGLRCYDKDLPEEINRRLTDSLSDYLFTPTEIETNNLLRENLRKNIFFVGNIMIDSLKKFFKENKDNIKKFRFYDGVLTLHRPENVDKKSKLKEILTKLKQTSKDFKILFPVHPRTQKSLERFGLLKLIKNSENIKTCKPLKYSDFLMQLKNSRFVITDSGGIQEETSYLGVNCFTLRKNTERPITITSGTNRLIKVKDIDIKLFRKKKKKVSIKKWDGKTAERIIKILEKQFSYN